MIRNLPLYFVALALLAVSCDHFQSSGSDYIDKTKDWTEVVTMVVSSEIGTVYGMEGIPSEGMMVKEEGKKDWNPKYFCEIDGFEYVRGFEYRLKVEKTHLVNPPQDASSVRYKLLEVLSEEFRLGEGYVMSDGYIYYGATSYHDGYSTPITKKQDEHYLIIDKSEKTNALTYLVDNGFTVMENSEDGTGAFYYLSGELQDCLQITVRGAGDVFKVPGVVYTAPLYNNDENFKVKTFGRGNMVSVGFPFDWDYEKELRHMTYVEKYAEMLDIYLVEKYLSESYGSCVVFGVTNESAGNAVEVANWFSEVAGYSYVYNEFPEWAPTPDE